MGIEFLSGWSAEVDGIEELDTTSLYPSAVSTPAPPHANESRCLKHDWKELSQAEEFTLPAASDWITVQASVYVDDVSPTADNIFLAFDDDSGNACWTLLLVATPQTGRIELLDANDDSQGVYDTGMAANTWYDVRVKFKHSNSTDIEVWFGGTRIFNKTTFDASSGGTKGRCYGYCGSNGDDVHVDHLVILGDDGATIDTYATKTDTYYYRAYRNSTQGSSPDVGNNLNSGNWSDAGEQPGNDANYGVYELTAGNPTKSGVVYTDDGASTGPNGDAAVGANDEIVGALYVSRCRSAVNLPFNERVKFSLHHGSSDSYGTTAWVPAAIPGVWNQNSNRRKILDGAHADCPTTTEYGAIGVKGERNADDNDLWIGELWVVVCYREGPTATALDYERGVMRGVGRGVGRGVA
jgi:hypothetical protein